MKKQLLTTVLGLVLSAFSFGQTANLPVNFDNALVNYDLVDFGGNSSVIAADPANAANKVCKTTKTITAQTWAGTTIAGTTGFSAAIGFTPTYTTITMLVYSPTVGTPIRMKVEDATNATHSVETEAVTTLANAWDTLVFDFANQATGTAAINYTYVFNKLSIFSNFGTDGATAGAKDYYYDDITFNGPSGPVLVQVDLPIRFDATNVNYALTDFGGTMSALVADPANAANKVCKTTKTNTAQTWAGTTIGGAGLATAIPFAVGSTELRMRVYSPNSGVPIRVKLEDAADGTKSVETEAITTVANAWDTLVFNFANQAAGTAAINFAYTYNKLSVFPNFGTDGATAGTKDYYYDDVEFVAPITPVLTQVDLPITFEDTLTVDYALVDFGGTASDIVVDPSSAGNTVVKVIKTGTAQTWGGTTFGGTGLASAIPFNSNATKIKMMVYSPDAGTHIRLKAENAANGALSVETEALTTIANAWDTLEFDFSNPAGGTQQLNLSTVYNKLSVFPNFGTDGATAGSKTYYFDNVMFVPGSGPVLNQVSLPTNFDSSNVAYSLVDFGGNASLIDADPVTPSNKVLKATKTNGAQTWAGTTIGGTAGFISAIPFTINATKMSMDIYSPDAGVHVRMKAEDPNDPTHSVETEAITTVANTWETLEFNFANQATGTAAINFSYNYQKLSLFFNFGTDGATAGAKTYYADNIVFGSFVGVKKVDKSNIKLLATKGGIQLISSDVAQVDQIEIYDVVGKQIYFSNQKIAANTLVPVSFNASTLYLIKLKVNNQQQTFKVVITE